MWFILFPKLEKFGLLGILQHYELVAEKLLLKVNCVIFIEERERESGSPPQSPDMLICRCLLKYMPGGSHKFAGLTGKERFGVW